MTKVRKPIPLLSKKNEGGEKGGERGKEESFISPNVSLFSQSNGAAVAALFNRLKSLVRKWRAIPAIFFPSFRSHVRSTRAADTPTLSPPKFTRLDGYVLHTSLRTGTVCAERDATRRRPATGSFRAQIHLCISMSATEFRVPRTASAFLLPVEWL